MFCSKKKNKLFSLHRSISQMHANGTAYDVIRYMYGNKMIQSNLNHLKNGNKKWNSLNPLKKVEKKLDYIMCCLAKVSSLTRVI